MTWSYPSPMDRAVENDLMIDSYVPGCGVLAPVPFERVAGFIREPVTRETVCVPEDVQRASILRVCADWDLRLTRIYQGSWYRPSRRPGGSRGPDGMPLVVETGIDGLARAIRHGAITAVGVCHIGVIGTLRQTRKEFYRILRGKGDARSGDSPRGARLVVSDFMNPAPRLMAAREWVKRHGLAWQGAVRDTLDNNLTRGSCGRDLEQLTDETIRAMQTLGRGFLVAMRGYGVAPETGTRPIRDGEADGEPDDEWANRQAGYRLAITSAWLGAHVPVIRKRLSEQLQRLHGRPDEIANQFHSALACPCTARSMLKGDFHEMPADRIGRSSIALDNPSAVRVTDPGYPWDRLPRLVTASMPDDPGRVVAESPR